MLLCYDMRDTGNKISYARGKIGFFTLKELPKWITAKFLLKNMKNGTESLK